MVNLLIYMTTVYDVRHTMTAIEALATVYELVFTLAAIVLVGIQYELESHGTARNL